MSRANAHSRPATGRAKPQGCAKQDRSLYVPGHEVAWARRPADSTTRRGSRGKGGPNTVGSPAPAVTQGWADTAVSIERRVVSGHAYAILAPGTVNDGRCGYDNPTN